MGSDNLDKLTSIAQNHIKTKWKSSSCILCGVNDWRVRGIATDNIEFVLSPLVGDLNETDSVIQLIISVILECSYCGNIHKISAQKIDGDEINLVIKNAINSVRKK